MIVRHNFRNKGSGEVDQGDHEESQLGALQALCVYELGFGGRVSAISLTSVEVRTEVVGDLDRTVFEGSAEEMAPLVRAALAACHICENRSEQVVEAAATIADALPVGVRGIPMYLEHLALFLLGAAPTTAALLAAAEIEEHHLQLLPKLQGLGLKGLMAAVRLKIGGLTFTEGVNIVVAAAQKGVPSDALLEYAAIAETHEVHFRDVLEAGAEGYANGGASPKDMPELIAMSRSEGIPLLQVVQQLACA